MAYRFELLDYQDRPAPKYLVCPKCGKRRLIPYTDTTTGQYLFDGSGKCERVDTCGYWQKPDEVQNVQINGGSNKLFRNAPLKKEPPTYMDMRLHVRPMLTQYERNTLVVFLLAKFGPDAVAAVLDLYFIGTAERGAAIFWYLSAEGRVIGGKIMLYGPDGHRKGGITWAHSELKLTNFVKGDCLFGEHLLGRFPHKPVALVESEKTAIIGSIVMPQYVWLATGGKEHLTVERCKSLKGRKVYLYPDLGGFDKWSDKLKELNRQIKSASFEIDDTLERFATDADRARGLDVADFLLRLPAPVQKKQISTTPERLFEKGPSPPAAPKAATIPDASLTDVRPPHVEPCATHVPPDVAAYLTLSELHRRAPQAARCFEDAHGSGGWWSMRVHERMAAWAVASMPNLTTDPPTVILERMRAKNETLDLLIQAFQTEVEL